MVCTGFLFAFKPPLSRSSNELRLGIESMCATRWAHKDHWVRFFDAITKAPISNAEWLTVVLFALINMARQ